MKRRELLTSAGTASAAWCASTPDGLAEAQKHAAGALRAPAGSLSDPTYIDSCLDCRSISFENPTGGGGRAGNGRKGRPARVVSPGEKLILADLTGAGTLRHMWAVFFYCPPKVARALRFEALYDGASGPSISVPILDFFGLLHGRITEYNSAMISVNEGRGLNFHIHR